MTLEQTRKVRTCGLLLSLLSFVLLCIASASAIEFGFSPPEIYLNSYEKCADIELYSDRPIVLDIQEKWSGKKSRDVRDYIFLNGSFLSHPEMISVRYNEIFEVCLNDEIVPSTNALLMLNIRNSSFSGGIWIHLSELREIGLDTQISGFLALAGKKAESKDFNFLIVGLLEIIVVEIAILCILFALIHRKKHLS